jgi:hypothetical protein
VKEGIGLGGFALTQDCVHWRAFGFETLGSTTQDCINRTMFHSCLVSDVDKMSLYKVRFWRDAYRSCSVCTGAVTCMR